MKKSLYVLFSLLLLLQTISSSLAFPIQSHAQGAETGIVKKIELLDEAGNPIMDQDTKASSMKVSWSIEGLEVEKDKAYIHDLPTGVDMEKNYQGEVTNGGKKVGSYYTDTNNTITITFNEEIVNAPRASGTFIIDLAHQDSPALTNETDNQQALEEEAEEKPHKDTESNEKQEEKSTIEDNLPKEDDHVERKSEKSSESDTAQSEGTEKKNKLTAKKEIMENILTSAELSYEDTDGNAVEKPDINSLISINYTWELANNHGYKAGDEFHFDVPKELKVYNSIDKAEMNFNGETIGYFSVNESGSATITFTKFIEDFSNINGSIEIWTELSEDIIITEEKEVIVTPIEGKESVTIPIEFLPIGPSVEKKGIPNRDYNAETIEWTVDFNKSLESLKNPLLQDPIQAGQSLLADSIKLYHLDTKLNGEVSLGEEVNPNTYTIGKTENGEDFTIVFDKDIHTAYRLVYQTEITDEDQKAFHNEASLVSDNQQPKSADATVSVKRGSPLEKQSIAYDKENQIITWEIKYNYNEKTIKQQDALLKDFFNTSQDLVESSFDVKKITIDKDGNEVGNGEDFENYTVTAKTEAGKNGFHLQFDENVTSAYKITYQTKASERVFENEKITNKVETGNHNAEGSQNIGQQILFKSHGTPNYKDKTVDWTVTFNKDKHPMNDVVLTDVFTNEGLILKPETLKIATENKELVEGKDYTLIKNEANQFEIRFNNQINTPHTITYTTEFIYEARADKGKNYLENKAIFNWTDEHGSSKTQETSKQFKPDEYTQSNGFKYGSYNAVDKEITWNIGVNYNLKTIENPIIKDFIQGNQRLVKDSITIYKMNLTGGENGTEVEEHVPSEDYSISWIKDKDGTPGFQISFNQEIHSPYKIVYKTSLKDLDLVDASYENTATLYNGETKETDLHASVAIPHGGKYTTKTGKQNGKIIDWKVNINFGQSRVTNATVIDNPSENQSLLESSFDVYATTISEDGKVAKKDKLERDKDYTLTLHKNPDSFTLTFSEEINEAYILEYQSLILDKPGSKIKNDVSFNGENIDIVEHESSETVQVRRTSGMGDGTGEIGHLTVTKTDKATGVPLQGAVFSLVDKDSGVVIDRLTTGKDGVVAFDRLLYGDYILTEEKAPDGYLIDNKQQTITIYQPFEQGNNEKTGNQLTVTNTEIIRAVELTKKDKETNEVLAGAVFSLQEKVGDTYEEIAELTTDDQGIIFIDQLKSGEYRFMEKKAPDGYKLSEKPIPFSIHDKQTEAIYLSAENEKLGSVQLTKFDQKDHAKVLKGATFKLEKADGTIVHPSLTTNDAGEIFVGNLQPGNYQFVETKAPTFYQRNHQPIPFTVKDGETATILVEAPNQLIRGKVELTKVDSDNKEIVLEGATFNLLDNEGNLIKEDITTNGNGKLVVNNLQPGNYQFVETKAPEHYQLNQKPMPFTIEKSKTEDTVHATKVQVTNQLIPGSVELTKVDKYDHEKFLENAVFELQDKDGNTIKKGMTTNEDGKLLINNLRPGHYQFVETKAPAYYQLDQKPIEFEVKKSQAEPLSISAENEWITGKVELTKVDADNSNISLSGAEFTLEDAEGNILQEGLTTNKAGKLVVDDLKPGNYRFVETKAPFGYYLDDTSIPFTIEKSKTEADVKLVQLNVENKIIPGSVVLTKVDHSNSDKLLPNAEFKLQDANGKTLKQGLLTDAQGQITVDNLKPGSYQFVETKAPIGYQLDSTPIPFKIEKGQSDLVRLTATNQATLSGTDKPEDTTPTYNKLPQTGEEWLRYLLILGITSIMIGTIVVFRRRKQV
ncbi:Ig-like domain-containing protein [Virgibacillus sp. AGTR]|uniref:SpaA isopeptide-forming pilin-related protein n=1 Tax=Virgibacillus sp. AGTR TaxID=2812055 RepID=UPI001962FCED|nr:SpaA isopeptide-forming pilin-related protein [Virgibacillus sp. AGTR]MCC2248763.1 Ig-like domain-containing protein [Virgibacillus sp. AGTR]QRZ17945.1 LPXTG cell wall anchor domain-containing protein [Virgibacillus sp. AGTR]